MYMHKCGHHIGAKVLYALAWISAIVFWWASWKGTMPWMMDSTAWFQLTVVFSLLAFGTKFCWCGHGMMMGKKEGMMGKEGYCAACEGKGGEHTHM